MTRWETAFLPWDLFCSPGRIAWEGDNKQINDNTQRTDIATIRLNRPSGPIWRKIYVHKYFLQTMFFSTTSFTTVLNTMMNAILFLCVHRTSYTNLLTLCLISQINIMVCLKHYAWLESYKCPAYFGTKISWSLIVSPVLWLLSSHINISVTQSDTASYSKRFPYRQWGKISCSTCKLGGLTLRRAWY